MEMHLIQSMSSESRCGHVKCRVSNHDCFLMPFSDRVAGAGCFGAKLMLTPDVVGKCMKAMEDVVDVPVTVKCRLGKVLL